jgi:DeoR/GlpR family transcriptional regulator of sugar metabolism
MIHVSTGVTFVADSEKFYKKSLVSFAKIDQLDRVITNQGLSEDKKQWLETFECPAVDYV